MGSPSVAPRSRSGRAAMGRRAPFPVRGCVSSAAPSLTLGGDAFHRRFLTWGRNVSLLMELTAAGSVFRLVVEEHTCNEWSNWINADNLMWKMHNQLAVEGGLFFFLSFFRTGINMFIVPSRWCVQQHKTSRHVHMLPSQAHMCGLPNNWPSYANMLFASLELNKYIYNQSQHLTFSWVMCWLNTHFGISLAAAQITVAIPVQGRKLAVPWVDTNEATPSSTESWSCRNNWESNWLFRSQTQLINCGCRQWSWHIPVQWLSLPNCHLSFMQMETQWISCHQAPSFSLTMGTASSVSCMLEAMNRELSSLIYLHIEDMEKTSLLAYSPAYSNICETRRRIWALFVLQISVPLNKGAIAQASLPRWVWDSELATVTKSLRVCRLVDKRQFLD